MRRLGCELKMSSQANPSSIIGPTVVMSPLSTINFETQSNSFLRQHFLSIFRVSTPRQIQVCNVLDVSDGQHYHHVESDLASLMILLTCLSAMLDRLRVDHAASCKNISFALLGLGSIVVNPVLRRYVSNLKTMVPFKTICIVQMGNIYKAH